VTRELTGVLGREPTEEEIEGAAGSSWRSKVSAGAAVEPYHVPLVGDELPCNDTVTPEVLFDTRRDADSLRRAMRLLSPRLRRVLELFYFQDARLHEIGATLGVSESRACQLRRLALSELKVGSLLRKRRGIHLP
jgi:RNA polymerase sigma factor for flagellar operon FliA